MALLAYLVLLRVEIARFTLPRQSALRGPACASALQNTQSPSRLVSVALILTSRWTAVSRYAALCSPDFPPVRPFGTCTSGDLTHLAQGAHYASGRARLLLQCRP